MGRPLQITWSKGSKTEGDGFTVMEKSCGVPLQVTEFPKKMGVTLICPDTAINELLIPVNEFIVPVPDEFKPMVELLLFQL